MSRANIPNLEPRFLAPTGWQWREFTRAGRTLRFGWVSSKAPKATIVCLPGVGDFIEKFFETAHWALENNYSFYCLDWVCQGKSTRLLPNPHKRHSTGFQDDIDDLHEWLTQHMKSEAPLIMLAHSMGGNMGLHYLQQHPEVFNAAAFTAPMFGIKNITAIPGIINIARSLNKLMGKCYVPGGWNWSALMHPSPRFSILTKDPARNPVDNAWAVADPELQIGAVTYGWVYEAILTCQRLKKAPLESIQTHCLLACPEHEKLVDNNATRRIVKRLPSAELLELKDSWHEILMERDPIRNKFLQAFKKLIEQNIQKP